MGAASHCGRRVQVLIAIDELDDLMHNAKLVPLSDHVRVSLEELHELMARIRSGIHSAVARPEESRSMLLLAEIEQLARDAPKVPLTSQVRIDKERVYDLLDQMRVSIVDDIRPPGSKGLPDRIRAAVETIDGLLGPGLRRASVDPDELADAIAEIRAAVESELEGFHRTRSLEPVTDMEEIAAEARPRLLGSRVRVDAPAMLDCVDRLSTVVMNPDG